MLHTSWTDAQRDLFTICMQSMDIDGLTVPPIRSAYMMQYRNALIGKHFKTLMQIMPFHVHDLVTPEQFELVKAVGELGALLWVSEIEDMDKYLVCFYPIALYHASVLYISLERSQSPHWKCSRCLWGC